MPKTRRRRRSRPNPWHVFLATWRPPINARLADGHVLLDATLETLRCGRGVVGKSLYRGAPTCMDCVMDLAQEAYAAQRAELPRNDVAPRNGG